MVHYGFGETRVACVALLDSDCVFGIAFLRGCYHKVLRPRCHIPKFGNGLCRHPDIWVYFDPHLIWQACKGYVESGNVLRFINRSTSSCIFLLTGQVLTDSDGG